MGRGLGSCVVYLLDDTMGIDLVVGGWDTIVLFGTGQDNAVG
jgi:hypothetical protein